MSGTGHSASSPRSGQPTIANIDRFLDRFHTVSFLVLFTVLVGVLALTIYHAVTHHAAALNTDLLIALVLGTLLLAMTVRPKRR